MLRRLPDLAPSAVPAWGAPDATLGLADAAAVLRRRARLVVAAGLCALLGLLGWLALTPHSYTATATLFIDPQGVGLFADRGAQDGTRLGRAVDSEVEILRSRAMALATAARLASDDGWRAARGSPGRLQTLAAYLGLRAPGPPSQEADADAIVAALDIRQRNYTAVVEIRATTRDAALGARLANAFIAAYLDSQQQTRLDTARRASGWIADRLAATRAALRAADAKV